ncbi:hypothetical protein RIF29_24748 [Crotalaria pallida]|uniref:Uncharacterized protein n=1 Tax=Crotalaria pallida TaxID=3830 RepID=A0AAN9HZ70_CROPI
MSQKSIFIRALVAGQSSPPSLLILNFLFGLWSGSSECSTRACFNPLSLAPGSLPFLSSCFLSIPRSTILTIRLLFSPMASVTVIFFYRSERLLLSFIKFVFFYMDLLKFGI